MALVGQNGAGKSTLIKILTGAYRRDEGAVVFAGEGVSFSMPAESQARGIATIYQEINLAPSAPSPRTSICRANPAASA